MIKFVRGIMRKLPDEINMSAGQHKEASKKL